MTDEEAARHVHYAYVYGSSMGSHLSNTACGISASWFEAAPEYMGPAQAMQRTPGRRGWWSSEPVFVDCPACVAQMPLLIHAQLGKANQEVAAAQRQVDRYAARYVVACERADQLKKGAPGTEP